MLVTRLGFSHRKTVKRWGTVLKNPSTKGKCERKMPCERFSGMRSPFCQSDGERDFVGEHRSVIHYLARKPRAHRAQRYRCKSWNLGDTGASYRLYKGKDTQRRTGVYTGG